MSLLDIAAVIAAAISSTAACGATAGASSDTMPSTHVPSPEAAARADSVRQSYTPADVEFMTGMIHHHAQALVMAGMAPTHGASPPIEVLAERIINGQKGEIALMQRWLSDRNEPVPQPEPVGTHTSMQSGDHTMHHMPGMLTAAQLEEMEAARGAEFDRLFLTYMIQHHRGALTMVDQLFSTYGAGQGDAIFKIASGIGADQTSEIDRMQSMLREMMFETADSP
ncbi:MAG: DUF305 domain-containing protein [Gemmatimonadota bacterium]